MREDNFEKVDEFAEQIDQERKDLNPYLPVTIIKAILIMFDIVYIALIIIFKISIIKFTYYIIGGSLVFIVLTSIFFRRCKCDPWIVDVAKKYISSAWMKRYRNKIVLSFDINSNNNDIQKFISDITNKSELYNYFIVKTDFTNRLLTIKTNKKQRIPEKCSINQEVLDAELENYIPFGLAITDKSEVGYIGWYFNTNEKCKATSKPTNVSVSCLISGGTGSGKSVLENNIIRHINRYHETMQGILVDVKRVEFGNKGNLKGIKAVATDVKEAAFSIEAIRQVMMHRFKFMEDCEVNNVYDIKDFKCNYYDLDFGNGCKKHVQFDEIVHYSIDGEMKIGIIEDMFNDAADANEVIAYFDGTKKEGYKIEV